VRCSLGVLLSVRHHLLGRFHDVVEMGESCGSVMVQPLPDWGLSNTGLARSIPGGSEEGHA
jgi:hypothetical protein